MKKRMIMFTILCTLFGGCRTHEYCEYKSVNLTLCGGELIVHVWSKQINYEKGRKKRARHGFPYELVIGFDLPLCDEKNYEFWKKFVLKSITIKGVETGKTLVLEGGERGFSKVGYSAFRFSITEDMGLTYEPFDIEADIKIIHSDGTEKSEHIKVRLEKDYRKKRQSDTWDFLESV